MQCRIVVVEGEGLRSGRFSRGLVLYEVEVVRKRGRGVIGTSRKGGRGGGMHGRKDGV